MKICSFLAPIFQSFGISLIVYLSLNYSDFCFAKTNYISVQGKISSVFTRHDRLESFTYEGVFDHDEKNSDRTVQTPLKNLRQLETLKLFNNTGTKIASIASSASIISPIYLPNGDIEYILTLLSLSSFFSDFPQLALTDGLTIQELKRNDIIKIEIVLNNKIVKIIQPSQLLDTSFGLQFSDSISGINVAVGSENYISAKIYTKINAFPVNTPQIFVKPVVTDNRTKISTSDDSRNNKPLVSDSIGNTLVTTDAPNRSINLGKFFLDWEDYRRNKPLHYSVQNNTNSDLFDAVKIDRDHNILIIDHKAEAIGSAEITIRATDSKGLFTDTSFTVSAIAATNNDDTLYGSRGNDYLDGAMGNDNISGLNGNDTLVGSTGLDTLIGGTGSDIYIVDATTEVITENADNIDKNIEDIEDSDTVASSVDYILPANSNLENLVLTGNNAVNATGNELANVIKGNSANNNLNGGIGDDILDGGDGLDTLIGGDGYDVYIVDTNTDTITENADGGMDTVASSVAYTLAASLNLENITLTGNTAINATGNEANNQLQGNSGNNLIDGGIGDDFLIGGEGVDTLIGGIGNDFYSIDNTTDLIIENNNEGEDFINSSVSYNLSDNAENLTLDDNGDIKGIGNSLNNNIVGNRGNNFLDGATGDDTLNGSIGADTIIGGSGNDRFVYMSDRFDVMRDSDLDVDTITDFTNGTDKIVLSKNIFTALKSIAGDGFSIASEFAMVADDRAVASSKALIVYSAATRSLFYNQNGFHSGFGSGQQFIILNEVTNLSAKDFMIQP